jgi:hypothetical protein
MAVGQTHPVTAERVALADRVAGRPPSDLALAASRQDGRWFARVALSWGVPVVLGIAIAMWSLGSGFAGLGDVPSVLDDGARGPSAVWSEHLALARLRAAQVDPGAVLYRVTAQPSGGAQDWLRPDGLLVVMLDFVGRESTLTVSTLDTKAPEVYNVSDPAGFDEMMQVGVPLPDRETALSRAGYLRIKPRLALAATLPDGMRFGQLDHADLYPYAELDLSTEEEPAWVVTYAGTAQELRISVDAKTGGILSRDVEAIDYEDYEGWEDY